MVPLGLTSKLAKLNFLVADDRDMLSLIVPYLHDMGVETVYRATDGSAALEILHRSSIRIDIVICDWELPEPDGLEVLKFVRNNYGDKPFLMLTSQATRGAIATATKHGVTGCLAKPFTVQLLEMRVAALLRAMPDEADPDDPRLNEHWEI